MKIEKVIFQNIGVYVNTNMFDLQADKPIVLIGGMNGRGKTTFLESILFALYGRRSVQANQSLNNYLRRISNTSGESTVCSIEIFFTIQEQELVRYHVKRKWDCAKKSLRMTTQVCKNGEKNRALSENWDMFVEEILPRAIASFFFFDGEKIAELAASENDEHIRSSIMSLLGIDIINQLIDDLYVVSNSNQKMISQNHGAEELDEITGQLDALKKHIQEKETELTDEAANLDRFEKELSQMEGEYLAAGGNYAKYRKRFVDEQVQVKEKLEMIQSQQLDLAASSLPLKLVDSLILNIQEEDAGERDQSEIHAFVRQFPRLYKEYSGEQKWRKDLMEFYENVKNKVSEKPLIYHLDEDARERMTELDQILDEEVKQTEQLLSEKQKLNRQFEEIENYLAIKVQDEKIAELHTAVKQKSTEKGVCLQRIQQLQQEQEGLLAQTESLRKIQKQILRRMVAEMDASEENLRLVSYAQKQIDIFEAYKVRLQEQKTDALAKQMTSCFQKIISKEGLIQKISIDSKTLEFTYFNRYGLPIDKQILSSGEKQLLVIAMLWALGICSKSQFPLIIDTPLARLDSVHRASLIKNYFPMASEQVIILSTDQEITKRDYEELKQHLGKEYTLLYDEKTMSSSIRTGYFERSAV